LVNDQEANVEIAATPTLKEKWLSWVKGRFMIAKAMPSRANQAALVVFFAGLCMEIALTIPGIPTGLGLWADYLIIGTVYSISAATVMAMIVFLFSFFYLKLIAGWLTGVSCILIQTSVILQKSNWGWKATSIMATIIVAILLALALLVSYLYAYRRASMLTVIATLASLFCIVMAGIAGKYYWNDVQKQRYIEQYAAILLQDIENMEKDGAGPDSRTDTDTSKDSTKDSSSDDSCLRTDHKAEQLMKLQPLPVQLAEPGSYSYQHYHYSSDPTWEDDGNPLTIYTSPTDGSSVLKDWSWTKELYWGFTEKEIAMKGQLWIPDGEGPFPIVFIMHGNHLSEEDSSDGYGYLAELLASHGMIVSSIDANFLNYSVWSGIVDDDQLLRSWLMLAHMNKLHEQPSIAADWNQVALIGHSRGGQAAAMAVDAKKWLGTDEPVVTILDQIQVKAVVAIAPTDYRVNNKLANLHNVNYLTLHGTMDADLTESFGERQYERTRFTQEGHFKATVEIYHANHGQFNTVWGKYDERFPGGLALNTADLMNGNDQRLAAQLFIHSFLQASFTGEPIYEAVFQDFRSIGDQLPLTGYVSRYSSSAMNYWYDFEHIAKIEDKLKYYDHAMTAKDIALKGRSGGDKQNRVLWVTWNEEFSEIEFPVKHLSVAARNQQVSAIVVSLARAERMMEPDEEEANNQGENQVDQPEGDAIDNSDVEADSSKQLKAEADHETAADSDSPENVSNQAADEERHSDDEVYTGLQLLLNIKATQWGQEIVDLEPYYHILHPAAHDFTKIDWLEENIKKGKYDVAVEPLLQTYIIPISLIEQQHPRDGALFASDMESISFIFKQEQGSMIIDAIGYITEGGTYVEYTK